VRLWYVAVTRARDLLILPRHAPPLNDGSWINIVDLDLPSLPVIDPDELGRVQLSSAATSENPQSRAIFADEAERITNSARKISWHRPSRGEADPSPPTETILVVSDPSALDETVQIASPPVAGSATRGTILHKLMEEV
jgi:ATP-dependent exoDNAse (exonuclease V) beta subunit